MLDNRRRKINISPLFYYNNEIIKIYKNIVTSRVKRDSIKINIFNNNSFRMRGL